MSQNYTTQMDAARKGIITEQMKIVAEKEYMPVEQLRQLVAEGKVAICANKHHTCLNPEGVGSMLRTKINVNLGVSRDCKDYDVEMQKVMSAVNLGAEAIMDLSSHGNTQPFRQKLTHECPVMIGTVPVYDSVIHYQRDLAELTAQDFIDVVRLHAEDGVDFVTLHCGITRKTIEQIRKHKRKMNIVSRGGSLVFAWMSMTGQENPFYEHFDEILDICGCVPDRGAGTIRRTDQTGMGSQCPGYGGGPGSCAVRPGGSQYGSAEKHLYGRSILCIRTVGYRYCTWI